MGGTSRKARVVMVPSIKRGTRVRLEGGKVGKKLKKLRVCSEKPKKERTIGDVLVELGERLNKRRVRL